jgi:hypothetical protein
VQGWGGYGRGVEGSERARAWGLTARGHIRTPLLSRGVTLGKSHYLSGPRWFQEQSGNEVAFAVDVKTAGSCVNKVRHLTLGLAS